MNMKHSTEIALRVGPAARKTVRKPKQARWCALLALACLVAFRSEPAHAQVQEPVVNLGLTSYEDAIAFPGWLLETLPEYYHASTWVNGEGKEYPGSNSETIVLDLNHVAYIGTPKILGAHVGGEILLPFAHVDVKTSFGPTGSTSGLGDMTFGPLLQWSNTKIAGKPFFQRVLFDVTAPTGKYETTRVINLGTNTWHFNPYYAFTYMPVQRFEISARLHYLYNGENDNPGLGPMVRSTKAGQAFHENFAASYRIFDGFRLGANGYAFEQFTDDQLNGVSLPNSQERVYALGPGLEVGGPKGGVWLFVNGYVEFDAQNRPRGTAMTFDLRKVLPLHRAKAVAPPSLPSPPPH